MTEIAINYWAVLVCAALSMVVGFIWYGPIFGKKWLEVCGVTAMDMEARKKMQKAAGPLYAVQFFLTLFQVYVLAHFIANWQDASGVTAALWIVLAFVMPTVAGSAMWNNDRKEIKWARFLLQTGYQIVMFVIYGLVLGMWR